MKIIIDTREQKPLEFPGHEIIKQKLDEGDYNTPRLIPYLVIERKSMQDFYGSIIQDHKRFKAEILRSIEKKKTFYIFLEGTLENFYYLNWGKRNYKMYPSTLQKIVQTMKERYQLIIIECETRTRMSELIIQTLENEIKKLGDEQNGNKRTDNKTRTDEEPV